MVRSNGQQQDGARTSKSRPVHKMYGPKGLKLAIWENPYDRGNNSGVMHNCTVTKSWRDDSGTWHDKQSFGVDDWLPLSMLLQDAYRWSQDAHRCRKEQEREATESGDDGQSGDSPVRPVGRPQQTGARRDR